MKKILVAVFLFIGIVIAAAVWFSPLSALGTAKVYYDNAEFGEVGLCYPHGATVRVDMPGGVERMYSALERIDATPVKQVEHSGTVTVYAISPRVVSDIMYTAEGEKYNVMASCDGNIVCIGTPVLAGCY